MPELVHFGYPYYITGVDFDESTNKLWATYYDTSSYPSYNQYLMELNPAHPRPSTAPGASVRPSISTTRGPRTIRLPVLTSTSRG